LRKGAGTVMTNIVYRKRDGGIIADITSVRTQVISRESFHSSFTHFRTDVLYFFALDKLKKSITEGFFSIRLFYF